MSNADQTPGDAASTDSAPADMVEREQLRMLFEHMIVGTLISTGFAVFLAAHLYGIIRAEQLGVIVSFQQIDTVAAGQAVGSPMRRLGM